MSAFVSMMSSMNPAKLLQTVCSAIESGAGSRARDLLKEFTPLPTAVPRTSWSKGRLIDKFLSDGFTDRYSGEPLVFPGALRALSILMPAEFPYHPNWRQSQTHPAYWLLYPTVDHVIPLARGGLDSESNVVTTSMLRNGQKANWLLEELDWPTALAPPLQAWDGLLPWFIRMFELEAKLRESSVLRAWYRAAKKAEKGTGLCSGLSRK